MTDQLRGDALHCMGNEAVISPHIDQLAQEGTLFTSGYTSAPSSTPARAGLLTGMSPWHHGMLGYGRVAQKYPYEMPQMLRDLGYYTFGIFFEIIASIIITFTEDFCVNTHFSAVDPFLNRIFVSWKQQDRWTYNKRRETISKPALLRLPVWIIPG